MRYIFSKGNADVFQADIGERLFVNGAVDDSVKLYADLLHQENDQHRVTFTKSTIIAISGLTRNEKTCENIYCARAPRPGVRYHLGAKWMESPAECSQCVEQELMRRGHRPIKLVGGPSKAIVFDDEVLIFSSMGHNLCYVIRNIAADEFYRVYQNEEEEIQRRADGLGIDL